MVDGYPPRASSGAIDPIVGHDYGHRALLDDDELSDGESDDTEATIVKSPDDPRSPDDPGSSGSGTTFHGSGTMTPPVTPMLYQQQQALQQFKHPSHGNEGGGGLGGTGRAKSAHCDDEVADDIFGSAPFLAGLGGKSNGKVEKPGNNNWFNNNNNSIDQQQAVVGQSSVSLNAEMDIFGAAPFEKKKLKRHKKLQQVAATQNLMQQQQHIMGGGGGRLVGMRGPSSFNSGSGLKPAVSSAQPVDRTALPPSSLIPNPTSSAHVYTTTDEIFQGVPFKMKGSKQIRAAKAAAAYAAATGEPVNNRLFSATSAEGTTPLLSPELTTAASTSTTTTTSTTKPLSASTIMSVENAPLSSLKSNAPLVTQPPVVSPSAAAPPVEFRHHKEQSAFKVVKPRKSLVPVTEPLPVSHDPLVDVPSGSAATAVIITTTVVKPTPHYGVPSSAIGVEENRSENTTTALHSNPPPILPKPESLVLSDYQDLPQPKSLPPPLPPPQSQQQPRQTQPQAPQQSQQQQPQSTTAPLHPPSAPFKVSFESIEPSPIQKKPSLPTKPASNPTIPIAASSDHLPAESSGSILSSERKAPSAANQPFQEVLTRFDRAQSLNLPPSEADAQVVSGGGSSAAASANIKTAAQGDSTSSLRGPSADSRRISVDVSVEKPPIAKKPSIGAASNKPTTTTTSTAEFKPDIAPTDHFLASSQQTLHNSNNNNNSSSSRKSSTSSSHAQPTPPSPKIHPATGVMPTTPKVAPVDANSGAMTTPKQASFGEKIKAKSTSKKDKARAVEKQMSAFTNKSFEDIYSDPEEEQQQQQLPQQQLSKGAVMKRETTGKPSSSSSSRRSLSLTSAFASAGAGGQQQAAASGEGKQVGMAPQSGPADAAQSPAAPSEDSMASSSSSSSSKSKKADKKKMSGSSSVDSIADSLKKRFSLSSKS